MPLDETYAQRLEQEVAQRRQWRALRRRARAARVQLVKEIVASSWAFALRDLAGVTGLLLVSYGAWRVYEPAGYIVAGALLLAGAFLSGARE
jgi:hypothetical protein